MLKTNERPEDGGGRKKRVVKILKRMKKKLN
jgi:hypothetical protein